MTTPVERLRTAAATDKAEYVMVAREDLQHVLWVLKQALGQLRKLRAR